MLVHLICSCIPGNFIFCKYSFNILRNIAKIKYIFSEGSEKEEPRILGLAMIPGHHIVSISIDKTQLQDSDVQ